MNTSNTTHTDIDPAATAREQSQARKDQAEAKESERQAIKSSIAQLTKQRVALNELPEEAKETLHRLEGQLDAQRSKFFSELHASQARGQVVNINFGSPGAMAYLLYDQLKEELPNLVRQLSGGHGMAADQRASQLSRINGEIIKLSAKLAHLGG
jgi:hypothetical protein